MAAETTADATANPSKPKATGDLSPSTDLSQSREAAKTAVGDVGELKDLVLAYAKQETVDPLKSLVRFLLWGVIGAILLSLGAGLLILAAVRAAQSEGGVHLSGSLTWVPYVGGLLVAVIIAGIAVSRISKGGGR